MPLLTTEPLAVYVNDHLAGSTVGVGLARRLAENNQDNRYGPVLRTVADEIEEDREILLQMMERLSIPRDRVRVAVSWGAEQASRVKLSSVLMRDPALSRLEELEMLGLGVEGKLSLWQALRRTHADDARLQGIDLEDLTKRARSQRQRLERLRRNAADEAFSGS